MCSLYAGFTVYSGVRYVSVIPARVNVILVRMSVIPARRETYFYSHVHGNCFVT